MAKETMTDVAFGILSGLPTETSFSSLWKEVAERMAIPAEKMSRKKASFYSELMLDNRFASLKGNVWDLRSRRKFDEFHAVTDVDDDDDEEEIEEIGDDDERELVPNEEQY